MTGPPKLSRTRRLPRSADHPCNQQAAFLSCETLIERAAKTLGSVRNQTLEELKEELKRLLVENLALEGVSAADIADDADLFGENGIGLDSLDGVEVVVILHRHYGLDVKAMQKGRDVFQSINTLAPYVLAHATK
jgi:acyl carrier protein